MKIFMYPLGQLQANCYFLVENDECIIIDPADSADFILEELLRKKLDLIAMIATHGHFDHIMAAGEIQLSINAPFYINKEDLFLVQRMRQTAKYFLGFEPTAIEPTIIKDLKAGVFRASNFNLQILHTPGHTPGASCIYAKSQNIIFTGDTLFKGAIGRYDFSYSNKKLLKRSLDTLFNLPEDTIVYSGHGEQTAIGEEKNSPII